ncbi:MAG: translation initiation factor IF-3 [Clostridia bacterium]
MSREWRVNYEIRAREVRVIGPDGEQLGVMPIREALRVAEEADLDLVEVAPQSKPPVCRLMDFGRFKYEQSKRDREARKKQKASVIKELRLSPKTDRHDIEVKVKSAERFLRDGDRVKINVRFRGREIVHSDLVRDRLMQMAAALAEVGDVERPPYLEGRQMAMVLAPKKTSGKDGGSRKNGAASGPSDGEVMVNAQTQDA